MCVCVLEWRQSEGRGRSIVAVVCLCFGCSTYRTLGEIGVLIDASQTAAQKTFLENISKIYVCVRACVCVSLEIFSPFGLPQLHM